MESQKIKYVQSRYYEHLTWKSVVSIPFPMHAQESKMPIPSEEINYEANASNTHCCTTALSE